MRNSNNIKIELIFIRHGATAGNEEKRYIGRSDEPLSLNGKASLKEKAKLHGDMLFLSPMERCIETAEILFPDRNLQNLNLAEIDLKSSFFQNVDAARDKVWLLRDFREIDFGLFEGKNYLELADNPLYQAWIDSGGTLAFPEGESREEFICRSIRAFEEAVEVITNEMDRMGLVSCDAVRKGKLTVAFVVHGGTIMSILSTFGGGDYFDYQVANGEGYSCRLDLTDGIRLLDVKKI